MSSDDVSKYEFLTGKDVLPENDLQEKAAATKLFEYSTLGSELRKESMVSEKHYQILMINEGDIKLIALFCKQFY